MMQMNNLNILKRYRNKSQTTENKIVTNDWIQNYMYMHLLYQFSWGFTKENKNWLFYNLKIIFELKQYSVSFKTTCFLRNIGHVYTTKRVLVNKLLFSEF